MRSHPAPSRPDGSPATDLNKPPDLQTDVCTDKETTMPTMKTSKTAAKRFAKTGTGKLRRLQQNRQHLFEKKPSTRTLRLDGTVGVHPGDARKIKRLLGER